MKYVGFETGTYDEYRYGVMAIPEEVTVDQIESAWEGTKGVRDRLQKFEDKLKELGGFWPEPYVVFEVGQSEGGRPCYGGRVTPVN